MKVLLVIPAIGETYGGPSKIAIELAQALGGLEMQVDLVTTNANGDVTLNVPLRRWVNELNYRVKYFPSWGPGDYKISNGLTYWLFKNIKQYNVVHIISVFSWLNTVAHIACRFHNVPYLINPQGMLEPWALSYKSWKKKFYYTLLEKQGLQGASSIQMLSVSENKNIEPLQLNAPISIIPNGLHRADFEQLSSPELFYNNFPEAKGRHLILFLARIDPKKGLDLLARAFSSLQQQFPNTHLVLAGPDNIGFMPTAKDYFFQENCLDSVTFTGMLTGSLKLSALAAADLYIAPSYSEGFSMSILEGMASGLPCIFTTGCNFSEAQTAGVAHVVDVDADAIANAMIHCLKYPEEAKAMGERARSFILENYTWNKIAANLLKLYQSFY